ncbi:MAG: T9SS type A sorting domain-containing protein [Candidatus Pacebacteria bacterium]|nr:T9SS type A sorting domain-containing protein [Candidatus Paceibacterota bacterium]
MKSIRVASIFISFFFILKSTTVFSQVEWELVNGPYGGSVREIAMNEYGQIFLCTDGGIYRSINSSSTWEHLELNTTRFNTIGTIYINSSQLLLAGSDFGIFRSTDNGNSWSIPGSSSGKDIRAFTKDSSENIYAGTYRDGILISQDFGKTWNNFALSNISIFDIFIGSNHQILAATRDGIYRSMDGGATWEFSNIANMTFKDFALSSEEDIYVCADYAIFMSPDYGKSWNQLNYFGPYLEDIYVNDDNEIFVGTASGVFSSYDKGLTWNQFGMEGKLILSLKQDSLENFFAGTLGKGLFYLEKGGTDWVEENIGLSATTIRHIDINSTGDIFVTTDAKKISFSIDNGETWIDSYISPTQVDAIKIDAHDNIYISAESGVIRSTNSGNSWNRLNFDVSPYFVSSIEINSDMTIFLGTSTGQIYRSTNDGVTWINITPIGTNGFVNTMAGAGGDKIYAGIGSFLYYSQDNGNNWIELDVGVNGTIRSLAAQPSGTIYAGFWGKGIFRSKNDGNNWEECNEGLEDDAVISIQIDDGTGNTFAAVTKSVYQYNEESRSWIKISDGLRTLFLRSLAISPEGYLFAGTQNYGLYRSSKIVFRKPLPATYFLNQNYPNPFNSITTIEFSIPQTGFTTLTIFNALGQKVETLIADHLEADSYSIRWNASGLTSGIYFYRLQSNNFTDSKKLVLVQ